MGLQKFDFLGLKTLTVINNALTQINAFRKSINLDEINLDELELDERGIRITSKWHYYGSISNGVKRNERISY